MSSAASRQKRFQELANIIKTKPLNQILKLNDYVDVFDNFNSWRNGYILDIIRNEEIKVRFDGWSYKYDEQHRIGSSKVALFKLHTDPYTGGTKGAIRDFQFEKDVDRINKIVEKLEKIQIRKFEQEPYEVIQYLRGEVYFVLDSILQENQTFSQDELKTSTDIFEAFLRFFIKWLEFILNQNLITDFVEGRQVNQSVIHFDLNCALTSCFPEFFDTLAKLFYGGQMRTKKFYQNNELQLSKMQQQLGVYASNSKDRVNQFNIQVISFVNYFGNQGGFEILMNLINWSYKEDEEIKHRTPFLMIKHLLPVIEGFSKVLTPAFRTDYLQKLKDAIFQRLENLTLNDLKETETANLFSILKMMSQSFSCLKNINQESESAEIKIAMTFIKSNILEKKIKGIKELNDIIEKVSKSYFYSRQDDYGIRQNYFNETSLATYFSELQVFDLILKDGFHPEVLKRAGVILKFIAEQSGFSSEQLDRFWQMTQVKHEAESKVIYEAISEMAKVLTIENLDLIHEKILAIPIDEYDSQLLGFIKDFSQNAISNVQNIQNRTYQKKQKLKYDLFGVSLLWEIIQDRSQLSPTLMTCAIMSFISCMKSSSLKSEREKFVQKCLENVKQGQSQPQLLLVAQHIIDSFGQGSMWSRDNAEDLVLKLSKEHNLVDLIVSDLELYQQQIRSQQGGKLVVSDPQQQVLFGKLDHSHNIQYRLEFLEYVNGLHPKKLDINLENFKKLWNILVIDPIHESDKNILLDLILKSANSSTGSKPTFIKDNQIEEVFKQVFCDKNLFILPNMMTVQLYKSIEKYFMFVNTRNQSFQQNKSLIKVSKFEHIVGLDFFWTAVVLSTKEEIISSAIQTLVNTHLRTEKMNQVDQKLAMWQQFMAKCKEALRSSQDVRAKGNIIRCLKSLIQGIEGKKFYTGDEPSKTLVKFSVQVGKDDKSLKILTMPSNYTLLYMRRTLNQEFGLKEQDYQLYFQNFDVTLPLENEEDYAISQLEDARDREKTDLIIQGVQSSTHPLYISINKFKLSLANNSEIAEILFDLLQSASESYSEDIWEVLTLLPQNKNIKSQIERLPQDTSEEGWGKILYFDCPRKLLYCLQIIDTICLEKKEKDKWLSDFVKHRGCQILLKYYFSLQDDQFKIIFNLKCVAAIAKTTLFFFKKQKNIGRFILFSSFFTQMPQFFDFTNSQDKITQFPIEIASKTLNYLLTFFSVAQNRQYSDQSSATIITFINQLFDFVFQILQQDVSFQTILKRDVVQTLIKKGLIEFQDTASKRALYKQILQLCKQYNCYKTIIQTLLELFNPDFVKQPSSEAYLLLLGDTLVEYQLYDVQKFIELAKQISDILKTVEDEVVLAGCFQVLYGLSLRSEEVRKVVESIGREVISGLFQLPTQVGAQVVGARCNSVESRRAGYQLLARLILDQNVQLELLKVLEQYVTYAYWRTGSYQNWNISAVGLQKSRTGFVGIKNLGCICYMNSLMQQLFTLPNFRECILEIALETKPASVLYQFQLLLQALKCSQKPYYDPKPLCNVLGPEGAAINVLEQMDVDEFWSGFMDKLENELKPMKKDLIIKRNFGGLLSNQLICKGCPHQSSREELFLALPLQVKNKKNIYQSLQTMTEGEMLEGDNAYFCEKCEKKVPTLMRVCIKKLPNVLLLVLKRFEFNMETLTKYKLNDFCEFPTKLNMRSYTYEYLKMQDLKQKEDQTEDENSEPVDITEYPDDYYEYTLRGVIIHMGTADNGHYYSLIKDQNNSWFEFNDAIVKPFDINELSNEAFGSDEKKSSSGNSIIKDRSRNAYMVFYERTVYFDDSGKALKNENELKWFFNKVDEQQLQSKSSPNQEILQDNIKFQINKIMFEKPFFDFSLNLLEQIIKEPTTQQAEQIGKFCLQFFLVVVVRSQDRTQNLPKILKPLKLLLKSNYNLSSTFITSLANKDILSELVVQNSVADMKTIIVGLISTSINCIAQKIDKNVSYQQFKKESANVKLILAFLQNLWEFRNDSRKCDQFFRIGQLLSVSSKNAKYFLLRHKTIGRILLYLLEEPPQGAGYQIINQNDPGELLQLDKKYLSEQENQPAVQSINYNRWDTSTHNYTYLVMMLSELFYSVKIFSDDQKYHHQLDDDEIAMLEDLTIIKRLITISYSRKARNAVGQLFHNLITTNMTGPDFDPWALSQRIIHHIYISMKDCEEKELKCGLVALKQISEAKDDCEDIRSMMVIEVMILLLKDGLNYWVFTEILLDFLIKICSQNKKYQQAVQQVLNNNKSVLKLIENWIKESQNPYNHFSQSRWKAFKKRNQSVLTNEITSNLKIFQQKAAQRNDALIKKIMKGEQPELVSYDSDDELPMTSFELNSQIDCIYPTRPVFTQCYDFSNYSTNTIIDNIDDMIELKQNPEQKMYFSNGQIIISTRWIHIEDDSICPATKGVARYKNFVNFLR